MTYQQIQNYPIGTKYNIQIKTYLITGHWYTEHDKDLILHQDKYTDLQFMDNNLFCAREKNILYNQIDGWLFNGKEWHCVKLTYNGYQEINDKDILEF